MQPADRVEWILRLKTKSGRRGLTARSPRPASTAPALGLRWFGLHSFHCRPKETRSCGEHLCCKTAGLNSSRRAQAVQKSRKSCRLAVEALEGRDVPSYSITDLGVSPGYMSSTAEAVNNAGQVVGFEQTADSVSHAFIWQNGAMTDLGTLGGTNSYASAINGSGQVVGTSDTGELDQFGDVISHAFLWENGVMTDSTPAGIFSSASGINDVGQVVGMGTTLLTGSNTRCFGRTAR